MSQTYLTRFRSIISNLPSRMDHDAPDPALRLWEDEERDVACYYAPFDHINHDAKIIIVGITPGHTQMNRALMQLQRSFMQGHTDDLALSHVKQTASLSGAMRPRIVAILNRLGYAQQLGIECCSQLWAEHHALVHFCSILKYPVFIKRKDYSGQVPLFSIPQLEHLLMHEFVQDLTTLHPQAMIVPLGEMVANVLTTLVKAGHITQALPMLRDQVIAPPHPSGANAESIALLMMKAYPTLTQYQDSMFQLYLSKQSWLNKANGKPQDETKYKKARATRWQAMARVRAAYGLT